LDLPTNLSSPHGLGIGLSVARRIIELHGGSITVHSDGPGRGTEAMVTLPLFT
jgi:signal transduction histidine kinase